MIQRIYFICKEGAQCIGKILERGGGEGKREGLRTTLSLGYRLGPSPNMLCETFDHQTIEKFPFAPEKSSISV